MNAALERRLEQAQNGLEEIRYRAGVIERELAEIRKLAAKQDVSQDQLTLEDGDA